MNLSNYLQMPPAPAAQQTPNNGPAQGTGSVVGLDSTGNLKLDFNQIMARQFAMLPQLKRQNLAVPKSLPNLSATRDQAQRDEANGAPAEPSTSARLAIHTHDSVKPVGASTAQLNALEHADRMRAQANRDASHASAQTQNRSDADASDEKSNASKRAGADQANAADAASLLALLQTGAPIQAPLNTPAVSAGSSDASAQALLDGLPLQTVALSAQTQLITDPRHAPSAQSLREFAQSMGMTPEAIHQLLSANQTSADALGANNVLANAGALDASLANPAAANALNPTAQAQPLQASLSAALTSFGLSGQDGDAAAMLTSMTATQVQAQSVGTPSQAVSAPPAMTTMQMLAPTDPNAAMQGMMQVSLLPVAPAHTPTVASGVIDVLSLHSADLPESQLSALVAMTADAAATGDGAASQDNASQSDGQAGGFANAPAGQSASTSTSKADATTGTQRSMAQAYERLGEKLSTEMAARMHQQINAGQWKMKFGLRPAHLGGVEVQLEMKDGKLNAQLQADNPMTRELLQNSSQRLRDALANLGVQTEQVTVGQNPNGFAQSGSQGQGSGNQPQVGDNLSTALRSPTAQTENGKPSSAKGSDTLLDLYA